MEARNIRLYPVDKLIPPPEAESQLDTKLVEQLAASLEYEGLREPLVVVAHGQHKAWIRHGVHRWAAAKKLGWRVIECVVEPQSASKAEHRCKVLVENLIRRHIAGPERDAMLSELVELRTEIIEVYNAARKKQTGGNPRRKQPPIADSEQIGKSGGRETGPRTSRGQARREVAEMAGVTTEAVRSAEKGAKRREQEPSEPVELHLDERGTRIPDSLWPAWQVLTEGMRRIRRPTKSGVTDSRNFRSEIIKLGDQYSRWIAYAQRWANQFKGMRYELATLQPAIVCPECKGIVGDDCSKCGGVGFFTYYQIKTMPELLPNGKEKLAAIEEMLEGDGDA